MRKLIAVTIALILMAAMLSSAALADNGKEHKGGAAGKGQNQTQAAQGKEDKGNSNGLGHTPDKSKAEGSGIAVDDPDDGGEVADENTGDTQEDADEDGGKGEPNGLVKKTNQEIKHEEKLQNGPNHGNGYGRTRNTQEVLEDIGELAGGETAAQLNTLMTAYRGAKDPQTAKAALTALLDALAQVCTTAATGENGEAADAQYQLMLENLTRIREKVLANAGNDNGTLLALIHAYENAFRIMNHLEPIVDQDDETGTDTQTDPAAVPAS